MHKSWKGWGRAEPHCIPPLKVHPHWAALTNMANSGLCLRSVLPDKVKAASSVGGTEPAVPCCPLPTPAIAPSSFTKLSVAWLYRTLAAMRQTSNLSLHRWKTGTWIRVAAFVFAGGFCKSRLPIGSCKSRFPINSCKSRLPIGSELHFYMSCEH